MFVRDYNSAITTLIELQASYKVVNDLNLEMPFEITVILLQLSSKVFSPLNSPIS